MKLLRFGPSGQEKPGLLDTTGVVRDLSQHVTEITPETLSPAGLAALRKIDPATLPAVSGPVRHGPPLVGVSKFLAVGLNFAEHAEESGMALPSEPILFMKAPSCIQGANDDVMLPKNSIKTDWEVELGVVIGETASYVSQERALDYVAGYLAVNDLSEREYQLERCGQWDKGKGCDTFGPIGPWLVTADEVGDPQNLNMWLDINGKRRQAANTRTMVFGVAYLISYISQFMTLVPGDIIATGTPPGVALGQKPHSVYLKAGDTISLGIDKVGEQHQTVVSWRPRKDVR